MLTPLKTSALIRFAWGLLITLPALSQQPQTPQNPVVEPTEETATFRSGVSNVRIDAQVTLDNELVTGLSAADFEIYDENAVQKIVYFGRDSEPLSLLLLLDVSGSMKSYVEQVAAVARQSLRFLRPEDKVGVMVFARNTKMRLELTKDLDKVAAELKSAVFEQSMESGTNINGALLDAAKLLGQSGTTSGRRAILVLTDNLGLNYQQPDEEVIRKLNEADAVLNGIVVGKAEKPVVVPGVTYKNPDFTPPDVFKIADETGGEAVQVQKAGAAFTRMIERIRTRYSIHYNKPAAAGTGYRSVRVELTPAARMKYQGAVVRARKGYYVNQLNARFGMLHLDR